MDSFRSAGFGAGGGAGAGRASAAAMEEAAAADVLYGLDEMSTKIAGKEHAKGVSTGVRMRNGAHYYGCGCCVCTAPWLGDRSTR